MSREDPQLKIRLPLELKEKITQSATDHGRSINSEVVARLEDSFTKHTPDFAITSIIPAYLTGLISKYETQKIVNLSVLSKIEATSDEPSIKFLKNEYEFVEKDMKQFLEKLRTTDFEGFDKLQEEIYQLLTKILNDNHIVFYKLFLEYCSMIFPYLFYYLVLQHCIALYMECQPFGSILLR